jgi:hypothetical protein
LPADVSVGLSPNIRQLGSSLQPNMLKRLVERMRMASKMSIHPDRLLKYALPVVVAHEQEQIDRVSAEHAISARCEAVGYLFGLDSGYEDHAEVRRRYAQARKGGRRVKARLESLRVQLRNGEEMFQTYQAKLPAHRRHSFLDANLKAIDMALANLKRTVTLDGNLLPKRGKERELSTFTQIYIWWLAMPAYRGKWDDMYQLAKIWRLSDATDVDSFRAYVSRVCRSETSMRNPFGSCLEQVLFEET